MNKAQLVSELAKRTGLSKKNAETFVNAFIEIIKDELSNGGSLQLVGFGSFKVVERAEREGRNPQTGKKIKIPATKYPKFIPGKALKEAVK
jgi:DNA-binding protein HU-beta